MSLVKDCLQQRQSLFAFDPLTLPPQPPQLAIIKQASELIRLLLQLRHLHLQLQILALQDGRAQRDVVLLGPAGVARPLGRLVVLAPPLPVRLVLVGALGHLVDVGEAARLV